MFISKTGDERFHMSEGPTSYVDSWEGSRICRCIKVSGHHQVGMDEGYG